MILCSSSPPIWPLGALSRSTCPDPIIFQEHLLFSRLLWTFPVSVLEWPTLQGPRCHSLGRGVLGLSKFLAAGSHSLQVLSGDRAEESFCNCFITKSLTENTTELSFPSLQTSLILCESLGPDDTSPGDPKVASQMFCLPPPPQLPHKQRPESLCP